MHQLDNKSLAAVIEGLHIPAQPIILQQLLELASNGESDVIEAAAIIERDVELSGLVLKAINSPVFGFNKKVSSIKQAAVLLGFDAIQKMVTTCLLRISFSGDACISLARFWDESVESATKCQLIGSLLNTNVNTDELYTLGLFHNCGIAAMAIRYPEYDLTLKEANTAVKVSFTDIEDAKHETNHAVVGFCIASSWGIPENIYNVTLHHHYPNFLTFCDEPKQRLMYCVLRITTNIIQNLRTQKDEPDWTQIKDNIFDELGITESKYETLFHLFEPDN